MISKLQLKGLNEITIRPVEFSPPVGPRGTSPTNLPELWECRITNLDKSRPDCVSRKTDPDEALQSAVDLFARQKNAPRRQKQPGPTKAELDEIEGLI